MNLGLFVNHSIVLMFNKITNTYPLDIEHFELFICRVRFSTDECDENFTRT